MPGRYLLNAAAYAGTCGHALAAVCGAELNPGAELGLSLGAIMIPCAIQLAGGRVLWVSEKALRIASIAMLL